MLDFSCFPYGLFEDDSKGFRHSIDKLIIDYELKSLSFSRFCDMFASSSGFSFQSDRGEAGYNSYFDRLPSSRYGWFKHSFWFPHVNVKGGMYYQARDLSHPVISSDDDTTIKKAVIWLEKNIIRVEFNPNKVFSDATFNVLISLLSQYCKTGILVECDYAVDVDLSTKDIFCSSRATLVSYSDSRYYGQRHTNCRIKVYNKSKEVASKEKIKIDSVISRCEITFRGCEVIRFHDISSFQNPDSLDSLSKNLHSIADLLLYASSFGEDVQTLMKRFVPDKRNRDLLSNCLFGLETEYILCSEIFFNLLKRYATSYHFLYSFHGVSGEVFCFGNLYC